jgi:LAO/AO transport system kinase
MDIRPLLSGDRRALARAITLVESQRPDHRAEALDLLSRLPPRANSLRLGLSGTPGVGKSSFIESFGLSLTAQGLRLAVLAIDPSSARTGGSVLGDKTRMERLSRDPLAFIRPSPSQATLGGLARRTREAVLLCEAAGYDVILIETVGVGQSETLVAQISDMFLLLLAPGGGDELQGVKRGIMELADLLLINKADGPRRDEALRTLADYTSALRLMRPPDAAGFPTGLAVSALEGKGLTEAWAAITRFVDHARQSGSFAARRQAQARHWFHEELRQGLLAALERTPWSEVVAQGAATVAEGRPPETAAAETLARILR